MAPIVIYFPPGHKDEAQEIMHTALSFGLMKAELHCHNLNTKYMDPRHPGQGPKFVVELLQRDGHQTMLGEIL